MRRSRTILVRIFLVSALLALAGIYGYYYGCEWAAKWAFMHQTAFGVDELVLIAVPRADVSAQNSFLTDQEEFVWRGEMVDVLHREVRQDTLFIYGFRDEAETELRQEAAWLYRDPARSEPPSDTRPRWSKWFSPFVLPYKITVAPVSGGCVPGLPDLFLFSSPRIRRPLLDVLVPPPDLS